MEDVFGQALYRYWKGDRKTPHLLRRDDGYGDLTKTGVYFSRKMLPEEKAVLSLAKGKILDVGCGAGRHTLYFQKKGFDITGIDTSPKAIAVCQERGCEKALVMDIFHPKLPAASFDTILLFGHNIGIGGTLAGVEKLLSNLRKLINPEGILLLNSLDPVITDSQVHQAYHQKCRAEGRYVGSIKIRIEYRDQIGNWFYWIHLDRELLREIAGDTHWQMEILSDDGAGEYLAALRPV